MIYMHLLTWVETYPGMYQTRIYGTIDELNCIGAEWVANVPSKGPHKLLDYLLVLLSPPVNPVVCLNSFAQSLRCKNRRDYY
jgi:hypothetical protein